MIPQSITGALLLCTALTTAIHSAAQTQAQTQDSSQSACASGTTCRQADQLDWVPYANLPLALRSPRALHCEGTYFDPLADLDTSDDPGDDDILAHASASEMQGDTVRLSGDVLLNQGYRQLRGDRARYNAALGTGTLAGSVELREPGILLRGDSAWMNGNTGEAILDNGQFVIHSEHIRGEAQKITRRKDDIIELLSARYSYCPPVAEVWALHAEQLELNMDEGVGTARKAKISIGDVPVFYLPYIKFPIDERRKTGFLWSELGKDSSGGLDFATPYYINLAPNYDVTLTPRLIADRGVMGEVQARYWGPISGFWEVGGSYIGSDEAYSDDFPNQGSSRWLLEARQTGLAGERWRTSINYSEVSDEDYLSDIGTTGLDVRQSTHLAQRGQLDYLGDNWQAELRFEQFQTIAKDIGDKPYKKLPAIGLNRTAAERDFALNLLYEGEYTYFDHAERLTGQRLYNEASINYPMAWIWGYVKPTAKYRHVNYRLDDPIALSNKSADTPDVGAPLLSLDGGLFFERDLKWSGSSLLQTLEPRLYYVWSDFEDQQGLPDFDTSELTFSYNHIFRETRFSGHDRIDDANQISAGLTTRIFDSTTGEEKLYASLGQIYYFDERRVQIDSAADEDDEGSSAIAAEFGFIPFENTDVTSSWLWNTNDSRLDETHLRVSYSNQGNYLFNLGYNYRRYKGSDPRFDDIDQIDISAAIPFAGNWSLFAQSLYDLNDNDSVNDLLGLEYNDCCWRIRVVHQRSLNQEFGSTAGSIVATRKATYLELQLKGLGGVGTRVTRILEEFIRGYESSDH